MALENLDILESLTIADLELLEEISGISMTQMDNDDKPKAKLLVGLGFILARKRGTPKSLDEIRAMPISEVESLIGTLDAGTENP